MGRRETSAAQGLGLPAEFYPGRPIPPSRDGGDDGFVVSHADRSSSGVVSNHQRHSSSLRCYKLTRAAAMGSVEPVVDRLPVPWDALMRFVARDGSPLARRCSPHPLHWPVQSGLDSAADTRLRVSIASPG